MFISGRITKEELDELLDALPHPGLCIIAYQADSRHRMADSPDDKNAPYVGH